MAFIILKNKCLEISNVLIQFHQRSDVIVMEVLTKYVCCLSLVLSASLAWRTRLLKARTNNTGSQALTDGRTDTIMSADTCTNDGGALQWQPHCHCPHRTLNCYVKHGNCHAK